MGPLGLCPKPIYHPADHIVDGDVCGGGDAPLGQGLKHKGGFKPGETSSSIFCTGVDGTKAKSCSSFESFNRENPSLVPSCHHWKQLIHGKAAGEALDLSLFLSETRCHVQASHLDGDDDDDDDGYHDMAGYQGRGARFCCL